MPCFHGLEPPVNTIREILAHPIQKTLNTLEFLTNHPQGLALSEIAEALNLSRSTCHRTLAELIG